ncbi:hypothetical protein [Candidatus Methylobacter oryzae]|uniref:hypothetical protein n=1 Tax=Candidatus Methylobacter oryzae TaxID=2497749 RepID=UPI0019D5AAD5|nr:hypothetical protein [Candidatus Methylobacter oryzae]
MHIEVELDDIHSERLLKLQQRLNKPLTEIAAEFLLAQGDGLFQLFMIGETEFPKMAALMHKYADLPMDLADASLILLTEHFWEMDALFLRIDEISILTAGKTIIRLSIYWKIYRVQPLFFYSIFKFLPLT